MNETLTRDRFALMEAVSKGEGTFDVDAWHAMDRRDNALVEQEVLHGMSSSKFVYQFKIQGKVVSGISVIGARHLANHAGGLQHKMIGSMHKVGKLFTFTSYPQVGIPMNVQCALLPELADEEDFFGAVIEIHDIKSGNTIQVEKRESRYGYTQEGGKYEKPHYQIIAQAKAYRNGILALVSQDLQIKWKVEQMRLGKDEEIGPDVFEEKRGGILRYAAANKIPVDRRAIEALTFDQIAGLSDAAKADKVDGFRAAAEALGILARLGITAEQMPQPRTATQRPASAPAPQQQQAPAPEQERQQAPATEAAAPQFEAVLYAADGHAVGDGVIYADPAEYARDLEVLHRATFPAYHQVLLEHNADGIEDARKASDEAETIIVNAMAETAPGPLSPGELAVVVPVVRNRPSWSGWIEALKAAQADLEPETAPAWIEAQRQAVESALPSAKLQAVRLLHATARRLSLPLPAWFATVVAAEEPPPPETPPEPDRLPPGSIAQEETLPREPAPPAEAKRDRDDIWADDFLGVINDAGSDGEVVNFCRYQSTVTVMDRLKREKPDLYRRVFDGIDAKRAALKAHKENGNEPNTAGQ